MPFRARSPGYSVNRIAREHDSSDRRRTSATYSAVPGENLEDAMTLFQGRYDIMHFRGVFRTAVARSAGRLRCGPGRVRGRTGRPRDSPGAPDGWSADDADDRRSIHQNSGIRRRCAARHAGLDDLRPSASSADKRSFRRASAPSRHHETARLARRHRVRGGAIRPSRDEEMRSRQEPKSGRQPKQKACLLSGAPPQPCVSSRTGDQHPGRRSSAGSGVRSGRTDRRSRARKPD